MPEINTYLRADSGNYRVKRRRRSFASWYLGIWGCGAGDGSTGGAQVNLRPIRVKPQTAKEFARYDERVCAPEIPPEVAQVVLVRVAARMERCSPKFDEAWTGSSCCCRYAARRTSAHLLRMRTELGCGARSKRRVDKLKRTPG